MGFDSIIFDLDGTLWNCAALSAQAFSEAYQEFGLQKRFSEEFVRSISGKPSSECDALLLDGSPQSIQEPLLKRMNEMELLTLKRHCNIHLYAFVAEGLERLSMQYKLYVVSNCGDQYMGVFQNDSGIGHYFEDTESHGRTGKSKAENLRLLVERNSLACTCYVGDTEGDERAAIEASLPFFHVTYGYGRVKCAQASFKSFLELTRYFVAP